MKHKTIRIKTYTGELIIYKTVYEFTYGKYFLSIILEEDNKLISKFYEIDNIISLELKTNQQDFKLINLHKYRRTK